MSHVEAARRADAMPVWTLTRGYAADLLGRPLADDEAMDLAACIPNSSIPDALSTIMRDALGLTVPEED